MPLRSEVTKNGKMTVTTTESSVIITKSPKECPEAHCLVAHVLEALTGLFFCGFLTKHGSCPVV